MYSTWVETASISSRAPLVTMLTTIVLVLDNDTHATTFKIKGQFINFWKLVIQILNNSMFLSFFFSSTDNRTVHQVFQTGLEIRNSGRPSRTLTNPNRHGYQRIFQRRFHLGSRFRSYPYIRISIAPRS